MLKRELRLGKLKEECVAEYIKAHNNIWPELVNEYKQNGMYEISCFLNNTDLYIYFQYDPDLWEKVDKSTLKWDKKWQKLMKTLSLEVPEEIQPKEVFRME
jgi:L-rhamnose mutarotase